MSKRKDRPLLTTKSTPPSKRPRLQIPDYHLTPVRREPDGSIQWPAPRAQMARARTLIQECAASNKRTLIVPDKDADGLSAGAILRHTLLLLGLPDELINVHLLSKGTTVSSQDERASLAAYKPHYIFVVDHGSRKGPPVIDANHRALIIDHHHATPNDFPQDADYVTACDSPPVATSSLLTYTLCEPLHPGVRSRCDWLAVVGTHGDLGNTLKWEPPFPDMNETFKKYTKKALNDVVSLINAPRRTSERNVHSAWEALQDTSNPASILKNPRLLAARAEVNAEVERCTHTAPKFSPDGRVAVFRISSEAQVHPVISTRWSGHLQSKALEMVMVANEGYLPGKVCFSCRIPRCARNRDPPISIIEILRHYASLTHSEGLVAGALESSPPSGEGTCHKPPLLERIGEDFARGHKEASGGIVNTAEFEELIQLMRIGVKPPKKDGPNKSPAKRSKYDLNPGQNKLTAYFAKSPADAEAKT